jgi:tight adherence protein C
LTQRCKKRKADIESEFPAIIEMLTLAIGAGESPASAFRRIAHRAHGHFAEQIGHVVQEVEQGVSFIAALDSMGREMESESVRLFTDSMVIAISRGSSLLETMEHAVQESRNQSRVLLIAAASKSEVSMLIPVVFLILPISILFALFPSLSNLNLFAS